MSLQRQLTMAALGLLCLLQLLCLWRAPAVYSAEQVTVTLQAGAAMTMERTQLGTIGQFGLRRDLQGRWLIRSLGARPLTLTHDGIDQRTGTHSLRAGESFRIGGSEFKMTSGDAFAGTGHDWRYDGATLWRDGSAQSTCPGTPAAARIVALWNRLVPARLTSARPLTFGGNLNCGNRIAIANLAAATAQLTREDGALVLAASGQARAPM
ncbi:MAG: hypothetical protein ACJ8GW_20360, partial [Massilia sp.]